MCAVMPWLKRRAATVLFHRVVVAMSSFFSIFPLIGPPPLHVTTYETAVPTGTRQQRAWSLGRKYLNSSLPHCVCVCVCVCVRARVCPYFSLSRSLSLSTLQLATPTRYQNGYVQVGTWEKVTRTTSRLLFAVFKVRGIHVFMPSFAGVFCVFQNL